MVTVLVRPLTRILVPDSDTPVTAQSMVGQSLPVGQPVSVTGVLDASGNRMVADLIVVGPRPADRRPAGDR
jgi:hypothetical protein